MSCDSRITSSRMAAITTKYILYFRPISKYHKAGYTVTEFTFPKTHAHIYQEKKKTDDQCI